MPLSPEARAKFDVKAAQKFFEDLEGTAYGYHNFLFGWIDTPALNYPPLLPAGLVPIAFAVVEEFSPSTVDIFLNQALNHRLNTTGLNLNQIATAAAAQNKSVEDLMAEVEVEGWQYTGLTPRDGSSYVCSAFVAAMYKAGGLLPQSINGPELTPRDVYSLKIYDSNFPRPAECVEADPELPYCQILGKYRMVHPGWNTIEPYDHMDETCPTMAPDYLRPDGC